MRKFFFALSALCLDMTGGVFESVNPQAGLGAKWRSYGRNGGCYLVGSGLKCWAKFNSMEI